ncbi:MAG: Gfo/Idh/MocA family oxidoreductase [Frankiales bacterium]|nr:Gfo/Idh/MocA family oxidoreductase [Frankiales bacterium]
MTVRWGFLGAGWIATRALAPAVHAATGAELVAVAARDPDRARRLEPTGRVHSSYAELLDDESVDAVYISLTNEVHAKWSIAALEAGKHVLCEKPLAMTAAEVDAMVATSTRADRLLVEASWYRWHPRTRLAEELVASGALGRVTEVEAAFTFDGPLAGNYRLEVDRGGGALYDVGCYAISAALWAFGSRPNSVVATQGLGPTGVDLWTEAELSFSDGLARIRAGVAEPPLQRLRIDGELGSLEMTDAPYTSWRDDETTLVRVDGAETHTQRFAPTDAYRLMVENVSAAIRSEPAYVVPLAQSRDTAAVIDACFTSTRSGGTPTNVIGPAA